MEEKNNIVPQNDTAEVTNSEQLTTDAADNAVVDSALQDEAEPSLPQDDNDETAYVSQFGEIEGVSIEQNTVAAVKVKKKRLVMPCIIVSVCLLLVAVIVGAAFLLFFNTSVTGTYVIEGSDDSVQTYFILEDNGVLTQRSGSIELEGTYEITNEDNVSKITFEIPANYVNVTYNYKLEGNKLTGMKMLMSDESGNSLVFVPATYVETKVEPIEKAQLDSKLIGKWQYSMGYDLTYTFNEDNTLVMSGNGMNIYGYYSAENNTVKIKYQATDVTESSASYSFDGEKLILNDVEFNKVSE